MAWLFGLGLCIGWAAGLWYGYARARRFYEAALDKFAAEMNSQLQHDTDRFRRLFDIAMLGLHRDMQLRGRAPRLIDVEARERAAAKERN